MTLNKDRWEKLWFRLGGNSDPGSIFDMIVTAYTEPHRFYHNDKHISDCLNMFDVVVEFSKEKDSLEASIWFHDIIYDTSAGYNEEKSAERSSGILMDGGISFAICSKVHDLILCTKIVRIFWKS